MEPALIRFTIPYYIDAPDGIDEDDSGPMFFPRVSNSPIGLAFERSSGDSGVSGSVSISRDRLGRGTRSKVQATIHPDVWRSIPSGGVDEVPGAISMLGSSLNDKEGRAIRVVVKALNKFLLQYRQQLSYHWIRPLTVEDIMKFEIKTDSRGFRERIVTGGPMRMGGDSGLQQEDAREIERRLEQDQTTNTYLDIHFDVIDKIDLGENNTAVVLSYVLFEAWVKNTIVAAQVADGENNEDALNKITDPDGNYHGFKNILMNHLEHILDVDFSGYSGYSSWESGLYELRHDVVHEAYFPKDSEAKGAHEEALSAIEYIRNNLKQDLSGTPEGVEFSKIEESPFQNRHQ